MRCHISAAYKSDIGKVRARNEDTGFVEIAHEDVALIIVADGMGGYRAGDKASSLAVETIRAELEPLLNFNDTQHIASSNQPTIRLNDKDNERSTIVLPETAESDFVTGFIHNAVQRAHAEIIAYGKQHRESRGMGSTVTLCVVIRNRAYFANVGDSRSYILMNGDLRPVTKDHSLVARLVDSGEITQQDVYNHPNRNLIYRSLGAEEQHNLEVDIFEVDLQSGAMIMLCSDGLWEKVHEPEMLRILQSDLHLPDMCETLIKKANEYGGEDNITVAIAQCAFSADSTAVLRNAISEADTGEQNSISADSSDESQSSSATTNVGK